jgi:hypothetical protein
LKIHLVASIALLSLAGCVKPTELSGTAGTSASVHQIPGCVQSVLRTSSADSCFEYQFRQTLQIRFCASANCCPDSNRFAIRQRISGDTIYVVVADTARPLCRCSCSYELLLSIDEPDRDEYVFFCTREDYSSRLVIYSERVRRY